MPSVFRAFFVFVQFEIKLYKYILLAKCLALKQATGFKK